MTELLKVLHTAVKAVILSVKGLTQRDDVAMTSLLSDKDKTKK